MTQVKSKDKATRVRISPKALGLLNTIVTGIYPGETRKQYQTINDIIEMTSVIVKNYQKRGFTSTQIADMLFRRQTQEQNK